jgi:tetratricopeptide (TPR) repeat protein
MFFALVLLAQAALLPPARQGLAAVPVPRLELLEQAVADQLAAARSTVAAAAGGADRRGLAEAYGALGQICHAYEFFDAADAAYGNASRLAPGDARWLHLAGALAQQTGRLEEAADRFSAVLRLDPDQREAAVRRAQVYLGLNRLREARAQFEAVAAVFPAVVEHGLGEIALRERRFAEAAEHFEAVLARVPSAAAVHYPLAMAYRGLGRIDEAQAHLARHGTGTVRPADPLVDGLRLLVRGERALVLLGRSAYEAGNVEQAIDAFRRALAAAPDSVPALTNLGLLLAQQGRDAEAVEHLRAAFERSPAEDGVRRALVGALVRLRRDEEAIAVLRRGTALAPDDEDSIVALAILLADRQRYREAVALLAETHGRFPEWPATATTLARLLASVPDRTLRDGARALEVAREVFASNPAAAHAETVALALAELERCREAAEWMQRAIAEATRQQDAVEVSRLTGELPRYGAASCRR